MKPICVIPARGGSKGVSKKNIRPIMGKPLIAYTIESALKSKIFSHVIVSTEDPKIASISKKYGAEVPFMRPKKLADDYTGTSLVVKNVIKTLQDKGEDISYVCCIYATAPFIDYKYILKAYKQLINSPKHYVFSATTYSFPVQRSFVIDKNNVIKNLFPEKILNRSQDLQEVYHDAGQFYWGLSSAFLNDVQIFSDHSSPIILPRYLVQDIDTIEDWKQAELMYNAYINNKTF